MYSANANAWKTASIFQKWIKQLDSKMGMDNRKVLSILDSAPTHIVANLTLCSIRLPFMLPKNTSVIQPLDAGIIAAFKKRYCSFHIQHALIATEEEHSKLYKVNILQENRWLKAERSIISRRPL